MNRFIGKVFGAFLKIDLATYIAIVSIFVLAGVLFVEDKYSVFYYSDFWVKRLVFGEFVFFYSLGERELSNRSIGFGMLLISVGLGWGFWDLKKILLKKFQDGKNFAWAIISYVIGLFYFIPIIVLFIIPVILFTALTNSLPSAKVIEEYKQRITLLGDDQSFLSPQMTEILEKLQKAPHYIENLHRQEHIALCFEINELIAQQDGPLTKEQHYLRNRINLAPKTLEAMLDGSQTQGLKWILLTPEMAAYHMFGDGGEFALKFVSEDGSFEAVYDKDGQMITDANNPVNMETYNYASPLSNAPAHFIYDVVPYFIWGNTGQDKLLKHVDIASNMQKFYSNAKARKRYDEVKARMR